MSFDPVALAAAARRVAGAAPDAPLRFLDGLERLASAVDGEARLHAAGRSRAEAAMVASLATQLRVDRLAADHPEIRSIAPNPVFITGLLRTGTTYLQQLLALHPDLRAPELWELMAPAGPGTRAELIAASEAYVAEYYRAAPDFRAIHHLDARAPEECHRLTANSFQHSIYALRYRIPSYSAWLREQSMVEAYEFHREQLQAILWRSPGDAVVLKCPSHLWHEEDLLKVDPDARIIRLHRSPAVSIPSVCSLTAVVRAARSDDVDRAEIGRYWLDQAADVLPGLTRREGDVRFVDLMADPVGTVERLCEYIGVPMSAEARRNIEAFRAGSKPPRHHYTAEEFGLSRQLLDERFAGYLAEFEL